jgi:5'(3')-deoxyribonucleotidase
LTKKSKNFTILVDVDGVVAAFYPRMLERILAITKKRYPNRKDLLESLPKFEEITEYWAESRFQPEHLAIWNEEVKKNSFWKGLKEIKDAVDSINLLHERGHKIFFLTTPTYKCRQWLILRLEWLQKRFEWVKEEHLLTGVSKYLVDGDVFIEDSAANLKEWIERRVIRNIDTSNLLPILFNAPYNKEYKEHVFEWIGIVELIEQNR